MFASIRNEYIHVYIFVHVCMYLLTHIVCGFTQKSYDELFCTVGVSADLIQALCAPRVTLYFQNISIRIECLVVVWTKCVACCITAIFAEMMEDQLNWLRLPTVLKLGSQFCFVV